MRSKKWKEILPLLASCTVLVVMGIVFFSLTKADAALLDAQIAPPTGVETTAVTTAVPAETTAADDTSTTAAIDHEAASAYVIVIGALLIALLLVGTLGGMIVYSRNHHGRNF